MGAGQLGEENRPLKVRAFFGLPVPVEQREELASYLADCAASAPEFRWTPAANLHLTVRFIGGIELSAAEAIADQLADRHLVRFQLELGAVGTFKRGRLVRVVWLQVDAGADAARVLAAQVEEECVRAGLTPEARPFQPHLTLARARPRDGAVLPPLPNPPELPAWPANELILYKSRLGRAGSVYEPLRSLRLS
ncbi:MAG TPA: RNA 2',3'-cyclic phosphodiesterase [Candidatus Eisenbacteria bacterium]|nr:RNA 2',3'-cyclic phosphodiesterase [Candidatus Eisenbacteria bacterium]